MKTVAVAFGKTLRKLRKEAGLTQEQLAFEAELQRVYVSILELGRQQPSLETVLKLARGLNCPPGYLVELAAQEYRQADNP
ncbi:anaerobic benzoate catabolism transcriptional regulator [Kingella potus]|uniref:Anaerobic benzoate catabolism transcriptional regulator n=1 Tax=Kingella potus TaxID=265175 RepID=A0A377R321_9NEIS|nr:helix-turn-helix transcriptional regulator [Kingella potus]UOP00717.1 helix-turn-helix domain-containing protein [Kingella potus]STR02886.1 anaerobic benzoate catabolism transcriptional regulator [Kingella potus]